MGTRAEGTGTAGAQRRAWWAATGQSQLRQLFYWLWDPIGVNRHFPYTLDEYDRYADAMRDLMISDFDGEELAAGIGRSVQRAQEAMGFDRMGSERKKAAEEDRRNLTEMILEWREQSFSLWLAGD